MVDVGFRTVTVEGHLVSVRALNGGEAVEAEQMAKDAGTWVANGPNRFYRPYALDHCCSGAHIDRLSEDSKATLHSHVEAMTVGR